jgi:hypothetical protein
LEITSQYYQASIRDDESLGEISDTPGDTIKESGMVPPSACPFCDGVSMHDPWCPYYEDPFDDDDPFEDDPWDDHSYNDPWDDDHDYEPIPVDEPWQILFTFAVFLLWMFFGNILIFGGLF